MHQNRIWQAFLIIITLVVLWFSMMTLHKVYKYIKLSAHTPAQEVFWSIKEVSDERFLIEGHYTFLVNKKKIQGVSLLSDSLFRHSWAAEQAIPEYIKKEWMVWYSPRDLEYSSLQKNFPLKECISMVLLWGVLAYFIGLGYYIAGLNFYKKTDANDYIKK